MTKLKVGDRVRYANQPAMIKGMEGHIMCIYRKGCLLGSHEVADVGIIRPWGIDTAVIPTKELEKY